MTRDEYNYVAILVGNTMLLGLIAVCLLHNHQSDQELLVKIQEPSVREIYVGNYTTDISTITTHPQTGMPTRKVVSSEIAIRVAGKLGHTIDAERKVYASPAKIQQVCETVFRSAKPSDLDDLNLETIKDSLKTGLSGAIHTSHIEEVILSNYRVYNKPMIVD